MLRKSKSSGRAALVERVVGWSVRHRAAAVGGWLALVLVAVLASLLVPGEDARSSDPGEAGLAQEIVNGQDAYAAVVENVLVQSRDADGMVFLDDPELRRATDDLVTSLARLPGAVTDVRSPLLDDGEHLVSADGRSGLVTFTIAGPDERAVENYDAAVEAIEAVADRHPQVLLAQAGDRSLPSAVDASLGDDLARSHLVSLPVTLVILVVVFGSLIAAGIPILLSLTTVVTTFGLLQVIGKVIPINSAANAIILLVGVAVGIDYSLFYLRRYREERLSGREVRDAMRTTARTSGHVVVVSGLTVMLCLTGLLFTGIDRLQGVSVGTVLVVGLAVAGSVTALPASLALLGRWVDRGRVPWLGRGRTSARESRAWSAIARQVVRRPLLWGGLATVGLVLVAVPAFGMRLQDAAMVQSLPRSIPAIDAAVRMQEAFPGVPTPARVVIWGTQGTTVDSPAVADAVEDLRREVAAGDGLLAEPITTEKVGQVLMVRIPLAGSGTEPISNRALEELRDEVLPGTLGEVDGIEYAVAGRTALAYDFTEKLSGRTPIVFGFVLVLAFVLLMLAFRSLAIPLVSIVLNLLSIGAAYGVLTWVFQDGHLSGVFDFTPYGGVVGWLPMFMFVILFGLSMDYHIFILSRIRERWAAGADPRAAIAGGIGSSAGVVTSAAVIMTAVFAIFVTLTAIEYKMLGVGMAVAVLVDATVVRGVLLPAAMSVLGERAWASPRWLARKLPVGEEVAPEHQRAH